VSIKAGDTALITGASSGIGRELAIQLARIGVNLVMVARSEAKLEHLAAELRRTNGVEAIPLVCDLSEPSAAAGLLATLNKIGVVVDILVNNAGFATQGNFHCIPTGADHSLVMVNVVAVVDLTRGVLPGMVERGHGTVLNVASLGAFQPAPNLAVYAASKSFVLSFSSALSSEYSRQGVQVLALCPGPVWTDFFRKVGSTSAAIGQVLPVQVVVAQALRGLRRGRVVVVPGRRNLVQSIVLPRLPRALVLALASQTLTRRARNRRHDVNATH
jgi:short-subunit dehydrogenase